MKLYDAANPAPNPRRVRVFAAEKGIELELVATDMSKAEHKTPEFMAKNPSGKLPVLELDDGSCIGESVAICRYLEAIQPEPNLFGATPYELGRVEMANRQLELEMWTQIGSSWVNGPVVGSIFKDRIAAGLFTQNPLAKETSDAAAHLFFERLNREFAGKDYAAGDRFTVADITLLCGIDFATDLVGLKPATELDALWGWHARMKTRPSYTA